MDSWNSYIFLLLATALALGSEHLQFSYWAIVLDLVASSLGKLEKLKMREKSRALRRFRYLLEVEQDLLRKTVRNQSVENLDNFVITKNKE